MRRNLRDYRGVFKPVGAVVMGLGVCIALCALVGFGFNLVDPQPFKGPPGGELALVLAAVSTIVTGASFFVYGRRFESPTLTRREAILSVAMIWFAAGIFGAIPFMFGARMSFADAFFESVSGLTTTGATVITQIESGLSRPLLLWRSLIQWLGGMGIVVLFVAVFPNIGAGGKHMFGEEVPGTTAEGLKPRIAETSRTLWELYALFTALEVLALWLLDMSVFEALCHALTTMSTGGFSTRDASAAAFESAAIELTLAAFMLIGSVNYGLYYAFLRNRTLRAFTRSVEFKAYLVIVFLSTCVLTFGLFEVHDRNLFDAFRYAIFMVATTISSTGYGTDDYMAYPQPLLFVVIIIMFVGGCAGSTAGGIKIERIVLMGKAIWGEIRRSFRPNLVHVLRMGRNVVPREAITDVLVFFVVYMIALALGIALTTTIEDRPIMTSFGAVLTCLSNMGPAPFYMGADNFASYSSVMKIVFAVLMLLGRLEFFALLSLLAAGFWKR